jgi:ubiquinone biosynthesis protein UbiJ
VHSSPASSRWGWARRLKRVIGNLEGVYLDRSARGLKPRFVKVAAPTDAEVAEVIATISQRVICKLQKLRYLEADIDATVAMGYDPLADDEPELIRMRMAGIIR